MSPCPIKNQQKKVRAENEERERRKVKDDLEQQQNEEARKASEFDGLFYNNNEQYLENVLCFENPNRKISSSSLSIEYEQNRKVQKPKVYFPKKKVLFSEK